MYEKLILIPPWITYGDTLSVIGMVYYLLRYYQKVYFYVETMDYFSEFFAKDPFYNQRIFLITDPGNLISLSEYNEYHLCSPCSRGWGGNLSNKYNDSGKISDEYYFTDANPLYTLHDIPPDEMCSPNGRLPNLIMDINHIFYYKLVGLNNNVRMNYFHYERDLEKEAQIRDEILKGIGPKYNIVNHPFNNIQQLQGVIGNNYPIINMNFLSTCPGNLLTLIEGAESIHLIEGCNVNFLYHCQYKNIFHYEKQIHFHVWLRNRNWWYENMNMDYAWKMMDNPRLNNWVFHFDDPTISIQ